MEKNILESGFKQGDEIEKRKLPHAMILKIAFGLAVMLVLSGKVFSQEKDFDAQVAEAKEYFLKRFQKYPDSASIVTADGDYEKAFFTQIEEAKGWDELVGFTGAFGAEVEFSKKKLEASNKKVDFMRDAAAVAMSFGKLIEEKQPEQWQIEKLVLDALKDPDNVKNPYMKKQIKTILETYGYDTTFLKD